MVGIVCALRRELGPLLKRDPEGCRILAAGMGAEAARRGAQSLIDSAADSAPLTALISAGYAGGLVKPALPGTIVVHTGSAELDSALPRAIRGKVVSTDTFIRTSAERAGLAARTGAVAVDWEAAAVARVAAERGLPFAAVKAITDGPDAELVLDWGRYRRPDGSLRTAAAVLAALRTPRGMAELGQLWYASKEASRVLSAFLADFLGHWNKRPGALRGVNTES